VPVCSKLCRLRCCFADVSARGFSSTVVVCDRPWAFVRRSARGPLRPCMCGKTVGLRSSFRPRPLRPCMCGKCVGHVETVTPPF
jgi:hypothetical protein